MSEESVNPNELMASIAKPRLTVSLIISLVVHIALLLLLSIGFLRQCFQYKTIHPKVAIKAEQKAAAEAAEKQAREDRMKVAQLKAKEEAEAKAKEESRTSKDAARAELMKGQKGQPQREKSDYEKKLEESLPPESAKGSMADGLSL